MPADAAVPGGDPMVPRRCRVTAVRDEAEGVRTLTLAPVDPAPGGFAPGQFNMLYAFGVGEAAISIAGGPDEGGDELLHTVRAAGATSSALAGLGEGAMLGVRGPFGTGWPLSQQEGRHLLFVAGGLGLAPLRPAILAALGRREAFAGLSLALGARSPEAVLYGQELGRWEERGLAAIATVDRARPGWTGPVGVVTKHLARALSGVAPGRVSAFVCGPEIMMRFTAQTLLGEGVPAERIWLSMERNMKCAIGHCGHCQYGPDFVCRDGPVLPHARIARRLTVKEL